MDDNYQTYLNRLARMTLPEAYKTQVQHIQESGKFQPDSGKRKAAPFPGYTLITPPAAEDPHNSAFYSQLETYQQELLQLPANQDLLVSLPPASFHLTVADLIWDSAFLDACAKNPQFEQELKNYIAETFQEYQQSRNQESKPIIWQLLGLIVMPRAIGIALIPNDEECYEKIIQLRRKIYQNPKLIALRIEQHYHFMAHITLGYFGAIPSDVDRLSLSNQLGELNQKWALNFPEFTISKVELRKFDDMTNYYRQPNWPSLDF
ncbi:MAG TPA: DUF1868 domain-containing protein [Nostocaceae cyanobacterium]|nr:DUF1868 domain-containing protein [Nostocaceae cyanobacterium]